MRSDEARYGGNEERVLVLLPENRDAGSIPRVLEVIGVASMICDTLEELCAEIDRGAGALLIEEEVLSPCVQACLHAALDSLPSWSKLPIMLLLKPGPETQVARDALLLPGDVTLIERPVRVNTLVSHVRSALRSRRRQYQVRDHVRALEETTESLRRAEAELRKANNELEVRVEERTEELSRALQELRSETEERIHAVEELRKKDQMLIQQSRTSAMGEMLGFIGHQWRQPLNSLSLIIQELSMSFEMHDLTQEHLDQSTAKAMRIIIHMSETIDDFRNFFKSNKEKVFFKISDVLSKSIKLAEASFFHEIQLPIDIIVQEDVVAEGYPNEYSQVILNILQNARDAALERKVEQPRIFIRIFKEKEKTVMTIADNAGGIPEENLDKLFDSYFTTKGQDKGTGIGLFISKTIIEKNMGGSLTVRNTGEGAEFRIEV